MRLLLFLLAFAPALQAQTVYESLMSLDKTYAPLFGKEVSKLSIQLVKEYDLNGSDTTLHVMVQVSQNKAEIVGSSIGVSLFSTNFVGGSAVRSSSTYFYNKESGVIILGYVDLVRLFEAFNNTFQFITIKESMRVKTNSLITYRARDIVFGGEHNPPGNTSTSRYYIQVGDAVFNIDAIKFREIGSTLRDMKNRWEILSPQ